MIGLMDCNNFFVSCERLFRPDLLTKPVAVLSSNDGCIIARSQEVKDYGIPMGIPYFEVRDICEKQHIHIFSSNFSLYRDISQRVMTALKTEFGHCEIYSVDEAFFTPIPLISSTEVAHIRSRIMQKTGIPVSIGIGETKTIAKVASVYAKKGTGVCILTPKEWAAAAESVSCGSVWGIGRQTTQKLSQLGIMTVLDFIKKDLSYIRQILGVTGERLYLELSGISAYEKDSDKESTQKSITSTRSFAQSTHELSVLKGAIGHHVTVVGEKLRRLNLVASRLSILCASSRYGNFVLKDSYKTIDLETPTNNTATLLKEAYRLLETLYDSGVPYKKAGVTVQGIMPEARATPPLFEDPAQRTKMVYGVVDALNLRFGSGTVHPGTIVSREKWTDKSLKKSPEYTTNWKQILMVKAT